MLKRILSFVGLMALMVLMTGVLTAATLVPVTTFTLVQGLPEVMNVGDTATVIVHVESSNQPFIFAQALPSQFFPGRGVVAAQGDHAGQGITAMLSVPFSAKTSTADFPAAANCPGGVAPVSVAVGVRYPGGYVAVQRYEFCVQVP